MKKLSDGHLDTVEALLRAASECPSAAAPARFMVFILLTTQGELSRDENGESTMAFSFRRSTIEALRSVCALVTGVEGTGLTDQEVVRTHFAEAMARQEEHLAQMEAFARAREGSRAPRRRKRATGMRRTAG